MLPVCRLCMLVSCNVGRVQHTHHAWLESGDSQHKPCHYGYVPWETSPLLAKMKGRKSSKCTSCPPFLTLGLRGEGHPPGNYISIGSTIQAARYSHTGIPSANFYQAEKSPHSLQHPHILKGPAGALERGKLGDLVPGRECLPAPNLSKQKSS